MTAVEASDGDGMAAGPASKPKSHSKNPLLAAGGALRRLGWGVIDQAVSSLTNFAASIYIVHQLGAVQFGAFSLAYVTYGFALNASRGLSTDPLMVRFSGVEHRVWRRAVRDCTGTALAVGLVSGVVCLTVAAFLRGTTGSAFLALGLTLPVLMLQDCWRYSFFAHGRGMHAFINDSVWAVTLIPALIVLGHTGHATVFWFTFAWGATAGVGAIVGILQANILPRIQGSFTWLMSHGDLGTRYLLEGTSTSVSAQVRGYGVSLMLGLAALGYVQASVTLMGPMTILFLGMGLVTIPEAARVLRRSPRHLPLFCAMVSVGLVVLGLIWGAALLWAVPHGLGQLLLGSIWKSTYPLVLPQILWYVGQGIGAGAGTGLHGLGAARRSLRVVMLGMVISSTSTLVGAWTGGALGTVYGMAVGAWIGSLLLWWQFRKACRESDKIPAKGPRRQPSLESQVES